MRDLDGPFIAKDFEAALGISTEDLEDYVGDTDLRWREICERGADSANARFREMIEQSPTVYKSPMVVMTTRSLDGPLSEPVKYWTETRTVGATHSAKLLEPIELEIK